MLFPILSAVAPAAPGLASRLAARALFTPPGRRSSPRADRFLATGVREDHVVRGQRIAAWRWSAPRPNAASQERLAFCFHGWGGSAGQFAVIAPALVARGISVLAIDGPGHGKSGGRDSSIVAMRDVLMELARREAGPVSVVAHSGGAVATVLGMEKGMRVHRLAFIGPPIDPSALMEQHALTAGLSRAVLEGVKRETEVRFGLPWTGLRMLPVITTRREPLLVVHDREDLEVPWSDGAAFAAAWPNATLMSTEGLGHRRVLYDPTVADAVASFIDVGCR